ncbi:hypothetical protein ACH5AO_09225 [Streptomyces sp. NPDC018964]|uniref:hypothetical protein n=1 Tax=Streptomyces sp. NPDC018964 TaxID=3365058 RepID=UPI00378B4A51
MPSLPHPTPERIRRTSLDLSHRPRFRFTASTAGRPMPRTTVSREFEHPADAFARARDDLRRFSVNSVKYAFIPFDERPAANDDVGKPGRADQKPE